jgi:hypothetical protein
MHTRMREVVVRVEKKSACEIGILSRHVRFCVDVAYTRAWKYQTVPLTVWMYSWALRLLFLLVQQTSELRKRKKCTSYLQTNARTDTSTGLVCLASACMCHALDSESL